MFWKISDDITTQAEVAYDPEEDQELDVVWNVFGVVVVDDDSSESEEGDAGPASEATATNTLTGVAASEGAEGAKVVVGEAARGDVGQGENGGAQS